MLPWVLRRHIDPSCNLSNAKAQQNKESTGVYWEKTKYIENLKENDEMCARWALMTNLLMKPNIFNTLEFAVIGDHRKINSLESS